MKAKARLALIRARKSVGLSQKEMADLVCADRMTIWRLENARSSGNKNLWLMLSAATGVPPNVLRRVGRFDDDPPTES